MRRATEVAILLALGWALVVPPSGDRSPRARWQQISVFKSAQECESVRAELVVALRRPFGDPWMVPDLDDPVVAEQNLSWAESQCVPATIPGDPAARGETRRPDSEKAQEESTR